MMNKYQLLQKVGSGNFSTVHLVKNIENSQILAMKVMKTHQSIALKQAYFLKNFDHPNIVKLYDFEQDPVRGETKMILEYLPENTLQLYEQQQFGMLEQQVKCILFQVALGLAYIHERGIIHRDIKPENILIDKRKAEIKLIDFGLAISTEKINTDYVATRWYRAPENLLGTKQYSNSIDVFSLACVVVELYLGNPLFPGADNIDQLYRIFNILGEPTQISWPQGFKNYIQMGFQIDLGKRNYKMKDDQQFGLKTLLKACSQGLILLLQKMLILNPKNRISSKQILLDPYFSDVKSIIPPQIFKRFEKDHILKKTTSKEIIENAEHFINIAKSKLHKNMGQLKVQNCENKDDQSVPNAPSNISNNPQNKEESYGIINFALSARKHLKNEENSKLVERQMQKSMTVHALAQKQQIQNMNNYNKQPTNPNHNPYPQSQNQNQRIINQNTFQEVQSNGLSFRGFNPMKSNKISVKQKKFQQNYSKDKNSQIKNRNNSIDSQQSKIKMISNSTDFGKPSFIIERRITNEDNRNYRAAQVKNKSLDKGQVLYYFGQNTKTKINSPTKMAIHAKKPIKEQIQSTIRMEHQNVSSINDSARITRNNSAINLPTNRVVIYENKHNIQALKQKQRGSHSPSGISLTHLKNLRNNQNVLDSSIDSQRAPIYLNSPNNRMIDKLRQITNATQNIHPKSRNDKSYQQNSLDASITDNNSFRKTMNNSILQPSPRRIEPNGKVTLIPMNKAYPGASQFSPRPIYHNFEHLQPQKRMASPESKLKPFRSLQPRQINEATNYFSNLPQPQNPKNIINQIKTIRILGNRQYRQPRITATKNMPLQNLSQLSHQQDRNININLNVSIIEGQKRQSNIRQNRNRF